MRILVSNDDGINAHGLEVLESIAAKLSKDVWVVAPEQEQSGAGHSLTLHLPVRARKITPKRYAVSGTPTDCVLLALKEIIPNSLPSRGRVRVGAKFAQSEQKCPPPNLPPNGGGVHLVLSGVNAGSNVGDDVTYSGTVAAAMEGTILGVPSVALSLLCEDKEKIHWETAEKFAPGIIRKLMKIGWPGNTLMNVNFPNVPANKVKGTKVCSQGQRIINVQLSERKDPKGRPYFWLGGERDNTPEKPGVDIDYLHAGYITITPICMDMTNYALLHELAAIF